MRFASANPLPLQCGSAALAALQQSATVVGRGGKEGLPEGLHTETGCFAFHAHISRECAMVCQPLDTGFLAERLSLRTSLGMDRVVSCAVHAVRTNLPLSGTLRERTRWVGDWG